MSIQQAAEKTFCRRLSFQAQKNYLIGDRKMTTPTTEKMYKRFDMQDEDDFAIETLEQMKAWLIDFWNSNPDEDMTDEEHDEMIEQIKIADEDEIFDRLGGIDYTYDEVDEDGEVIAREAVMIKTNLSWGFSVTSEKIITAEGLEYVMITQVRGKNSPPVWPILVPVEQWKEEHDKSVEELWSKYLNASKTD